MKLSAIPMLCASFIATTVSAFAQSAPAAATELSKVAAGVNAPPDTSVAATVEASSSVLQAMNDFVNMVDGYVWGVPLIAAILVTGLLLTCCLRLIHLFNLKFFPYFI